MPPPSAHADPSLPILLRRDEIVAAISKHQVVVICGETGSGKTTQLPQMCLQLLGDGARDGVIGHTQPRRLAARAVAGRIAEEMGARLGGLVGVKVRFQDQTSAATRIKVMTDGMLLAEMASDPMLRAYRTLIIDEAHERSLNIDFLLGCIKLLLPKRPDLKLIVTSATIDPARFSAYFGGKAVAPVIEVSGRMFPVEVRYHDVEADPDEPAHLDFEVIADAVEELTRARMPEGDVLVFLPGEREIRQAGDAIARRGIGKGGVGQVLPLFSRLTNQEQDRIFHPTGTRRVILATNVAETSLTVPGIRYVVDTGLARLSRYDPRQKIQRLPIEAISQASANQRAGRCGRVAEGVCIRLYSKGSYESRAVFTDPEIRRTNLANVILQMKALGLADGGDITTFPFLDPPDAKAIQDGYETLFELGAIHGPKDEDRKEWGSGEITEIGRRMSRMPLDPRVARMLIGAEREEALPEVLVLAAALSIQDPRERPMSRQDDADRAHAIFRHESSDFMTLLKLWDQFEHAANTKPRGELMAWCREHFLSPVRMREWGELAEQLAEVAEELELDVGSKAGGPRFGLAGAKEDAIHRALLTGLITNVACREAEGGSFDYRGVRGNVVNIFPGSVLFKKGPKWIMAAEVVQTTRLYARTIAKIEAAWIEEVAGHMFRRQISDPHLDAETGEPKAWERVTMSGIVVVPRREAPIATTQPETARTVFIRDGLVNLVGRGGAGVDPAWQQGLEIFRQNRATIERGRSAEAKLRRRGIVKSEADLAEWFDARLPENVRDPQTFRAWWGAAGGGGGAERATIGLTVDDVVMPEAAAAFDQAKYPDEIALGTGSNAELCELTYALSPGKDEDGVTLHVPLLALPMLSAEQCGWLVPGMLPDVVLALLKSLPKAVRANVDAKGSLAEIAEAVAGVLEFNDATRGVSLPAAISEALQVLHGLTVPAESLVLAGLPSHLRLRVRVVDEAGKSMDVDRDLAALRKKFEGRIRKARASLERDSFGREGITAWDFGDVAETIGVERDGQAMAAYPTLVDMGQSVALTLAETREEAQRLHHDGVRRLFTLACQEEVGYVFDALPGWHEMVKNFTGVGGLGTGAEFREQATTLIVERTFMAGGGEIRTKQEFDDRSAACWGRLSTVARDVGELLSQILEPRFKVAHRIARGTPRIWAESVADIREHAVYLMPTGFLLNVPWERLRRYPAYIECMRERLFALREDGSKTESAALAAFLPHWKKFTAWVAAAMSAERAEATAEAREVPTTDARAASSGGGLGGGAGAGVKKHVGPVPQTRRNSPRVNLDAGAWAMVPGNLPAAVEQYRWALEEFRVSLFAPALAGGAKAKAGPTAKDIEAMWGAVGKGTPGKTRAP
jgi:ATP-dependent helicase HrpA